MPSGYHAIETFEHLTEHPPLRDRMHEKSAAEAARAALAAAEELSAASSDQDWWRAVGGFQAATADLLVVFERLQSFADRAEVPPF